MLDKFEKDIIKSAILGKVVSSNGNRLPPRTVVSIEAWGNNSDMDFKECVLFSSTDGIWSLLIPDCKFHPEEDVR